MQFWVEKTDVASRPARQQGELAFGVVLWSPQSGKDGRDTYRLMREVKPGDVVFHLVDRNAITGVSVVAEERDDTFVVPEGTRWPAGKPAFLIRLHKFTKLAQSIDRSDYLDKPKYRSRLLEIVTKHDSLFFNSKLGLNQGAYLTIAPLQLIEIWEEIYFQKTGSHLPMIDLNLFSPLGAAPKPVVVAGPPSTGVAYWWLNANPKIWNFEETPIGGKQTYTSRNDKGNKRQKYKYFQEVKSGDLVVGYVSSPQKEVVAVCKITKGLHQTADGEEIEFEKVEQLAKPIAYETLQAIPELANGEPLINNQGSLFKLTEPEYEIIRSLIDEIDETNISVKTEIESYDKQKAIKGLFLAETQFDEMLAAMKEKMNVVLQGPPGVGKTYVAKRLAYALVGSNDPQRVEMIQFHQSYSYEDFIQGFRPTPKGHFNLKYGIFHQFCRRAQREEAQGLPYVFIIDEINRGNLSKIFGELMMLIEPDKRGKAHAMPLAYSQDADEKFYIPENLHLIGMMNTADRSLAMVDYALRRRFRFITLRPEFSSKAFQQFLKDAGLRAELAKKIVTRMAALNEAIAADTKNLGPGYQIGHSYFCPRNVTKLDDDWYRRVIESEIVPLIQEYWFDNEQRVKEHQSALLA